MAERTGRCLNTDYCALGDARSIIRVAAEAAYICPECARALVPVARWQTAREAVLLALGVLTVVGSAAAGFVTAHSIGGEQAWQRVQIFVGLAPPPAHLVRPRIALPMKAAAAPARAAPPPPLVTVLSSARFTALPPPLVITVLSTGSFTAVPPPVITVLATASFTAVPPPKPIRVVLRLGGSDTITETLAPRLAAAFLAHRGDTDIEIARTGRDELRVIGTQGTYREAVVLTSSGSAGGLAALTSGRADLALTARLALNEELGAKPDKSHGAILQYVIAQDPVAVIVNPANPLTQLTLAQTQALFAHGGRQTGTARRYVSDDMSGDDGGLGRPQIGQVPIGPMVSHMRDSRAVADAVATDPEGMGLVPMILAGANRVVAVLDRPSAPSRTLLLHPMIMAGPGPVASEAAQAFLRFVLSQPGQATVVAAGFLKPPLPTVSKSTPPPVPAPVKPAPVAPPAAATPSEKDPFEGMHLTSDTTHVFSLPANARMVNTSLADVKLPDGPSASAPQAVDPQVAKLPPPSPTNGVMKVDCVIALSGVPSDCRVLSAKGTKSGSAAVLSWLSGGGVRYAPAMRNGKPIAARRELTVNFRPPGNAR